jgi:hypothetical protein
MLYLNKAVSQLFSPIEYSQWGFWEFHHLKVFCILFPVGYQAAATVLRV